MRANLAAPRVRLMQGWFSPRLCLGCIRARFCYPANVGLPVGFGVCSISVNCAALVPAAHPKFGLASRIDSCPHRAIQAAGFEYRTRPKGCGAHRAGRDRMTELPDHYVMRERRASPGQIRTLESPRRAGGA